MNRMGQPYNCAKKIPWNRLPPVCVSGIASRRALNSYGDKLGVTRPTTFCQKEYNPWIAEVILEALRDAGNLRL